ncbi:helix-hairpin-helix domain-containing protein [Massilia sp. W12]|uniref:helix-hairpin-helix domain-containing protein n=1 Tax=Massilia sp. W12 TaxID=3126507 RepID=UPI0030D02408
MPSRKSPPGLSEAETARAAALADLRRIPGVGKSIAQDFYDQGLRAVTDFIGRDPQQLYQRQCEIQGCHVDRCWLYVARLAVYFAETAPAQHEKSKLLWWNWKDRVSG